MPIARFISATRPAATWEERPEELRHAIARVRAFQQAVIGYCNDKGIEAASIIASAGNLLPRLARERGLLVMPIATGESPPLDIAVFVVGADVFLPPVGIMTVTVHEEDVETGGTVSFYLADSLVAAASHD